MNDNRDDNTSSGKRPVHKVPVLLDDTTDKSSANNSLLIVLVTFV